MKNNGFDIFDIDENGVLLGMCETLNIPEGVAWLKAYSLRDYSFLTEVNIPASCEIIESGFIDKCDNVLAFKVAKDNRRFISEDGVLYTADKKKLVRYPAGKACEIFRVSDEAEEISAYAFADAKKLSGILIGKNCRSIQENAFVNTTACSYASDGYHVEKYLGIRKYYIPSAMVYPILPLIYCPFPIKVRVMAISLKFQSVYPIQVSVPVRKLCSFTWRRRKESLEGKREVCLPSRKQMNCCREHPRIWYFAYQ